SVEAQTCGSHCSRSPPPCSPPSSPSSERGSPSPATSRCTPCTRNSALRSSAPSESSNGGHGAKPQASPIVSRVPPPSCANNSTRTPRSKTPADCTSLTGRGARRRGTDRLVCRKNNWGSESDVVSTELERERDYVTMLYRRLDELQNEAHEQLAQIRILNVGDHDQSRSERDSFAQLYEDRILQLREVGERLAFGRLELEPDDDGPVRRYIGRIGLRDEELRPILLDWRVPQASAFYQATARTPMGARARRHLISKGRDLVRIEDEVFDPELLEQTSTNVQGEAALL